MTILRGYPSTMPSATVDFAASKKLDPRINFERASDATATPNPITGDTSGSVAGQFVSYGQNVARLLDTGLLIEDSSTNRWTNSQVFATGWSLTNMGTPTDNVAVAPDGTTTAASVFETATTDQHYIQTSNITPNADEALACSIFVKANGRNHVIFRVNQNFNVSGYYAACVDLTTGAITKESYVDSITSTFNFQNITRKVTSYGNGWYRIEVGYQGQSTNSTRAIQIFGATGPDPTFGSGGDPSDTYAGDANKGYYLWGAQVEDSNVPSSYIPTAGSEVTRAADLAVMPATGTYNPQEFTRISQPFGSAGGSNNLSVLGGGDKPAGRFAIYNGNLTVSEINAVAEKHDEDWWEWQVFGSKWQFSSFQSDGTIVVDWGDGTVEDLTTDAHAFSGDGGFHTIKLRLGTGATYLKTRLGYNDIDSNTRLFRIGPMPNNMAVDANQAFANCFALLAADSGMNITALPTGFNGGQTWQSCLVLKDIPYYPREGPHARSLWSSADAITTVPISDFSGVTDFGSAFANCDALTHMPPLDLSSVGFFQTAWYNCSNLVSMPLLNIRDMYKMQQAFTGCSSLVDFPAGFFDNWTGTPAAACFYVTWTGCTSMSATSVENILDSIDASGRAAPTSTGVHDKKINIDFDTNSGTPYSSQGSSFVNGVLTPLPTTISNLNGRNWEVYIGATLQQ